jgi:hypothetical protein
MHPLLAEEIARARIDELHRLAAHERRARRASRRETAWRVRWLRPLGELLVAVGVRAWARADRRATESER